jgi:threonyl-tRNA synthetase
MPAIRLPDGSVRQFDDPVSVATVAASIGPGLAKAALAGKVDGKIVDTSYVIDHDAAPGHRDRQGSRGPRRHPALDGAPARLRGQGPVSRRAGDDRSGHRGRLLLRLLVQAPVHAGRSRGNRGTHGELAKKDERVVRSEMPRDDAVKYFEAMGEHYKAEIIASIPSNEPISLYAEGAFTDLCRGPHVPSTGRLKVFKLMKLAGAYWRGDSRNEMLQRIYGTAWTKKEDLAAYLTRIEEAEKRDHRKLGRALDLFHQQDEAPGMIFWHPKGWSIWQQVEQYMRRVYQDNGYLEVKAPQILDRSLWERSGHWENFKENMFTTESEKHDFAVKPMNCPGHILIFNSGMRSYRDLPLRYGEFGACHRNEPSGALHGIMRVRAFTQDDGHIFCTEEQIRGECIAFNKLALDVYRDFGFTDVAIKIALRPQPR